MSDTIERLQERLRKAYDQRDALREEVRVLNGWVQDREARIASAEQDAERWKRSYWNLATAFGLKGAAVDAAAPTAAAEGA